MENKKAIGLYLHIPFCVKKCPYCDFYSVTADEQTQEDYVAAVLSHMEQADDNITADTLYLGGGTPNILPTSLLSQIVAKAQQKFNLSGEITIECNPCSTSLLQLKKLAAAGFNRISFGMQSAVSGELNTLGRRHSAQQAKNAVEWAHEAGFTNISADIMLCTPAQTMKTLDQTIAFLAELDLTHISAYMLKVEPNTAFNTADILASLPNEDAACDMYLHLCSSLESMGFHQYEISNFARSGFESRHNLKYWHCEEYLAFGPSAHGFFSGQRYFYPRSLSEYTAANGKNKLIEESDAYTLENAVEEYIMLSLRLVSGIDLEVLQNKFKVKNIKKLISIAQNFKAHGLALIDDNRIHLTPEGFLLSNKIIVEFISSVQL